MLIEQDVWIREIEEEQRREPDEEAICEAVEDIQSGKYLSSEYLPNAQVLALKCIDIIFAGKKMHSGGSIPKAMLHSAPYVVQLLTTDICDGVDRAYEAIANYNGSDISRPIDSPQQLVLDVLTLCAKNKVPKVFAGGILLMYLELVKGVI